MQPEHTVLHLSVEPHSVRAAGSHCNRLLLEHVDLILLNLQLADSLITKLIKEREGLLTGLRLRHDTVGVEDADLPADDLLRCERDPREDRGQGGHQNRKRTSRQSHTAQHRQLLRYRIT